MNGNEDRPAGIESKLLAGIIGYGINNEQIIIRGA